MQYVLHIILRALQRFCFTILLKHCIFLFHFTLQLGCFAYYSLMSGQLEPAGPIPIDSLFIYRPDKRQELWRFGTYMVLHAG